MAETPPTQAPAAGFIPPVIKVEIQNIDQLGRGEQRTGEDAERLAAVEQALAGREARVEELERALAERERRLEELEDEVGPKAALV